MNDYDDLKKRIVEKYNNSGGFYSNNIFYPKTHRSITIHDIEIVNYGQIGLDFMSISQTDNIFLFGDFYISVNSNSGSFFYSLDMYFKNHHINVSLTEHSRYVHLKDIIIDFYDDLGTNVIKTLFCGVVFKLK